MSYANNVGQAKGDNTNIVAVGQPQGSTTLQLVMVQHPWFKYALYGLGGLAALTAVLVFTDNYKQCKMFWGCPRKL